MKSCIYLILTYKQGMNQYIFIGELKWGNANSTMHANSSHTLLISNALPSSQDFTRQWGHLIWYLTSDNIITWSFLFVRVILFHVIAGDSMRNVPLYFAVPLNCSNTRKRCWRCCDKEFVFVRSIWSWSFNETNLSVEHPELHKDLLWCYMILTWILSLCETISPSRKCKLVLGSTLPG